MKNTYVLNENIKLVDFFENLVCFLNVSIDCLWNALIARFSIRITHIYLIIKTSRMRFRQNLERSQLFKHNCDFFQQSYHWFWRRKAL